MKDIQDEKYRKKQLHKLEKELKKKEKKPTNLLNKLVYIFLIIMIILSLFYLGYNIITNIKNLDNIISSVLIFIITILFFISFKSNRKKLLTLINSFVIILFIIFNFLTTNNIFSFKIVMPDFTNKNINDAIEWIEEHNIKYEQIYESSDTIKEFNIINQSVSKNTPIYNVKKIKLYISKGPDYNKDVIIGNMTGSNVDDVVKFINDNFLNNVEINYEYNNDVEKDIVINQSINGMIKRNDLIKFTISLGIEGTLEPVKMIDLKNKTLFEATLWLKRNGIPFEIGYEFSNKVKRNNVISQSKEKGTIIDQSTDSVSLLVSKGNEIVVPDLNNMSTNEIIKWISDNKLKITFEEQFSATIKLGKFISCSHKQGDIVEEGTTIKIITSKGSLKMKKFNSLAEFRAWTTDNNINIIEEYEFNDVVTKGEIIRYSIEEGAVINSGDTITVYISNGKQITIPSFINKNKSTITSTCKSIGLNCTFSYSYSNNVKSGLAISQNKRANTNVAEGTYVNIVLSNGPKPSNSSSSGNTSTPTTPSEPPTPVCDRSITETVYITAGNEGSQTKAMLKSAYPNINWSFNMVNTCPNGSSASGEVCNATSIHGKVLNHCDTYTVTIVN